MKIDLTLNGRPVILDVPAGQNLLQTLRGISHFSAKLGCETGDCGSCTVLLDGQPVNSCVVAAGLVRGRQVTTLEGLLGDPLMLNLQREMVARGAIQCGYCTPGILISLYALMGQATPPTEKDIRDALSGNLCRCTGYVKPVEAAQAVIATLGGGS